MTIGRQFDPDGKTLEEHWRDSRQTMKPVEVRSCHCVGPQNGDPLCPCQMRNVIKKNGRWVMPERDLGPTND